MANGKRFDMNKISVAHKTLPLGTRVRVINLRNGISIEATVTDRGPYIKGRIVDMSYGAAKVLDMVHRGIVPVRVVLC
jgi:rare lipoprotein A